jgi:hypothetical protein
LNDSESSVQDMLSGLQTVSTVSTFLAGTQFVVFTLVLQLDTSQICTLVALFVTMIGAMILTASSAFFFLSASLPTLFDVTKEDVNSKDRNRISRLRAEKGIYCFKIGLIIFPFAIIILIACIDLWMGLIGALVWIILGIYAATMK